MQAKELIIEISYPGMGDHLFHSHIPRIAKEHGIQKVYLSNFSKFGHPNYKKLIWEINPFIDGFIDKPGIKCDISQAVRKVNRNSKYNLLDEIMFFFQFNNGKTWNQPEIYYQPKFKKEYNYCIYDPNFVSWIGNVIDEDAMIFLQEKKIHFEYIMKFRGIKHMYIADKTTQFIETPTLEEFCNLIYSAKKLYCLTSGTATLAAALGRPATVFYGIDQEDGFKHFKQHAYILIPRDLPNQLKRVIKRIFN